MEKSNPTDKEVQKALMQKTDEELRALLEEENIYDKEFIYAVREELTGRIAGTRERKTAEEIRKEEEQRQREKEQRQQQEETERLRRQEAAAAERARHIAIARKQAKRVGIIFLAIIVVGIVIGFIIWNNTDERLLQRGKKALAAGNEKKAEKLFKRAADTDGDAAFELWKIKKSDDYLKNAADLKNFIACGLYGEKLIKAGNFSGAVPYLKNAIETHQHLPVFPDRSETNMLPQNYLYYLLGCAYWTKQDWESARTALTSAANYGYAEANVFLGDWYLCRGELRDYKKALEYYENAPVNWPGVKEKRQVLRDLKKRDDNFSSDSWSNANFWGEAYSYWSQKDWETKTRSVRRGIYENTKGHHRFIGKFDSRGKLLSGLGISTNLNGSIYAGNIKVKSINSSSYNIFYNGKGSLTDSSGNIKSGTWENDRLIGSYELTNIFAHTKTIKP